MLRKGVTKIHLQSIIKREFGSKKNNKMYISPKTKRGLNIFTIVLSRLLHFPGTRKLPIFVV